MTAIKSQGYWFESNRGSKAPAQRPVRPLSCDKLSRGRITYSSSSTVRRGADELAERRRPRSAGAAEDGKAARPASRAAGPHQLAGSAGPGGSEAPLEGCRGQGAGGDTAEVDVLGEAGPAVPEVVGDLPGGQAGVIEPGATVRRKVCDVAQGRPARSSAWRRSPLVLFGLRRRPFGLGKITGGSAAAGRRARRRRRRFSVCGGSAMVRRPASVLGRFEASQLRRITRWPPLCQPRNHTDAAPASEG
jgi:hypothetical protein